MDGSVYGSRRSTKSMTLVIPDTGGYGGVFRWGDSTLQYSTVHILLSKHWNHARERGDMCGKLKELEPTGPPDRTYKVNI